MFGEHKGHNFQQENEFYKMVEQFQSKISKKLKKLLEIENLVQDDFLPKYFDQQSKSKKKKMKDEVEDFFG